MAAAAVDEVNADIALPLVFEASTTKRTGGGVEGGGSMAPGGNNWPFNIVRFPPPARSGAFPAEGVWGDCDGMPLYSSPDTMVRTVLRGFASLVLP